MLINAITAQRDTFATRRECVSIYWNIMGVLLVEAIIDEKQSFKKKIKKEEIRKLL